MENKEMENKEMENKEMENKLITFYVEKKKIIYNKRYFYAYKTKFGKLNIDVKFIKDIEPPKESTYIAVSTAKMNINTSGDYPVIWVQEYC